MRYSPSPHDKIEEVLDGHSAQGSLQVLEDFKLNNSPNTSTEPLVSRKIPR